MKFTWLRTVVSPLTSLFLRINCCCTFVCRNLNGRSVPSRIQRGLIVIGRCKIHHNTRASMLLSKCTVKLSALRQYLSDRAAVLTSFILGKVYIMGRVRRQYQLLLKVSNSGVRSTGAIDGTWRISERTVNGHDNNASTGCLNCWRNWYSYLTFCLWWPYVQAMSKVVQVPEAILPNFRHLISQ